MDNSEMEDTSIHGMKIGDSVIVDAFCCSNEPEVTGFHLPVYLQGQRGIVVDINADKIKVRCLNQRWEVGIYDSKRFREVIDSLGFESGKFVYIGDSLAIEDKLWDEKIRAFRKIVNETDTIYDLKYKEGQNYIQIKDITVQSHPDWWRKLE